MIRAGRFSAEARLDLPFIHLVAVAGEEDLARYRKALPSARGSLSHAPLAAVALAQSPVSRAGLA